jgi:RimJ/RimL family protein N-acetyltransferase
MLPTVSFETDRLEIKDWHADSWHASGRGDLGRIVATILTEPVTRSLPDSWHGTFTPDRARAWIKERDREGTTLLVAESGTGNPVGLVILFEVSLANGIEVRVGYFLAEASWGKGFATELVEGLVRWCRAQTGIQSLAGGVARDNPASKRVLEKNGFLLSESEGDGGEETLRLTL